MQQFLQYTILGLVIAGIYFIVASGLVVTYQTSGIFNFAHGALAMVGSFFYWQIRFDWGWPAPVALVVTLCIFAPGLGALLYWVVMRGLRGTNDVTKIVVPVSVMLGLLALSVWIWNPVPDTPRIFERFFGNRFVSIAGINLSWHELISLALAVAIAAGLRFLFFRTRAGVAMRAVVDDPTLVQLTGGRPERMALLAWAIGGTLACLGGILITPIQGGALSATLLTLLVIDAFAAAMFGRLKSLPRTFLGAVVLGLAGSYIISYFPASWTWTGSFRVSLPMIMLFIVLLVLPQDRLRGLAVTRTRERFKLPSIRTAVVAAVVLVVVVVALESIMAETAQNSLALGMCLAIVALSLVLLTGYAGEINLAALSFGAIGTIVVFHYGRTGSGIEGRTTLLGFVLAAIVCAIVGALVALPALRLRGLYLALATMAFGVFVSRMVLTEIGTRQLPILGWRFSIFPSGSVQIPKPRFGPLDLNSSGSFLIFVTILFAVLGVLLIMVRHSSYGRRLAAMKDSPAACATLGLNSLRLKLSVFMFSAAIAGVGGALMASSLGAVNGDRYDILISLTLMMVTVVGGIGYVSGGLFGGILTGVGFIAIKNSFDKLGSDYATLVGIFAWFASLSTVLPATMGISMGKNPSGAISDMVHNYAPLGKARPVLAGGFAAMVGLYLLALGDVISNWWFVVGVIALFLVVPTIAKILMPQAFYPAEVLAAARAATPQELIGIDRPFTERDRIELDRALGVDTSTMGTRRGTPNGNGTRTPIEVGAGGSHVPA